MSVNSEWQTVIGLEIHVQINSNSKAFCDDSNTFGSEPNIHAGPITLAHPGTLPVANAYQIESAVKLGLAFGSKINQTSYFDRKNYFYPDLPKGYQITQDFQPICVGGSFKFPMPDGRVKEVKIHHLHMEEDAGKSIHDVHKNFTLLDFNRSGVPLIEIVTEPDMSTSEEVFHFIKYMQLLVRNLSVSDGNMEEGSLRCDCNVSVMPVGSTVLGTRCEIKNLNSKRFAKQAIEFEEKRQVASILAGVPIKQTTLLYNTESGKTYSMRDKEEANDYRYFNDPDLPPVVFEEKELKKLIADRVPTPFENYVFLKEAFDLDHKQLEIIIEKNSFVDIIRMMGADEKNKREAALLMINKIIPDYSEIEPLELTYVEIAKRGLDFINVFSSGKLSKSIAYQNLYPLIWNNFNISVIDLAIQNDLLLEDDLDKLHSILDKIIFENEGKVKAFKNGKKGLLGFFMGQAMRASGGKFDPKKIESAIISKLEA